jgi:1-aminocyclopropane-1-carboxylate deaminase
VRGSNDVGFQLPSPLVELNDERLAGVQLFLKRDDLIHPEITGNKWRKLKYLLAAARESGASTLLTFGGAYSNHVRAVAAAGRIWGFQTIGVIRGEERPFNDGLGGAVADGMRLHYLDRATYRCKHTPEVLGRLRAVFGDFYTVPEGGTTALAIPGCIELVEEIDRPFDLIVCPVGTGGTLAGLAAGLSGEQKALGISVLRGASSLDDDVIRLHQAALGKRLTNWEIDHRFHFGGFARGTSELNCFIADFRDRHGLLLDPIYVGKMLFGVFAMIGSGEIPADSAVVAVVTGAATSPPPDDDDRVATPRT